MNVSAYLDQARATIRQHGWMVQGVVPHVGQTVSLLAYTVGLTAVGMPELIMVGLSANLMAEFLNGAARHALDNGIKPGDKLADLASVVFRVVEVDGNSIAAVARQLYGDDVKLLQMVWPDKEGNYPGEPGWLLGDYQDVPAIDDGGNVRD